jgi:hypothetical protein
MAEGNGDIVYTYAGDSAGKAATYSGSAWTVVKGTGLLSPADHKFPGSFGQVDGEVTYNGLPLYLYTGELPYTNHEGGQWKSISLPSSLVINP